MDRKEYEKIAMDYLQGFQGQTSVFKNEDVHGKVHYMFAVKTRGKDWTLTWIPAEYGILTIRNNKVESEL